VLDASQQWWTLIVQRLVGPLEVKLGSVDGGVRGDQPQVSEELPSCPFPHVVVLGNLEILNYFNPGKKPYLLPNCGV
jgi:hypothetical protein